MNNIFHLIQEKQDALMKKEIDEIDRLRDKENKIVDSSQSFIGDDYEQLHHSVFNERRSSYDQVSAAHNNLNYSVGRDDGKRGHSRLHYQGYYNINNNGGGIIDDPSILHVRKGIVMMPIEMTIPETSPSATAANDSLSTSSSPVVAAPALSMKQSRIALYAAFPPPPPSTQNELLVGNDEYELKQVKQRLEQYSGFHGAVGASSSTLFGQGISETLFSLHYRFPTLLSVPSMRRNSLRKSQYAIGSLNYNILFGPTTNLSLGGTLSSLNGKAKVHLCISNPFLDANNNSDVEHKEKGILHLHPLRRNYRISISSRHFFASNPIFVHFMTYITPIRRHNQFFNVVVQLQNPNDQKGLRRSNIEDISRPKITLCAGYGVPSLGGNDLLMSQLSSDVYSPDFGIDSHLTNSMCGSYGARVKLELEQTLPSSQVRHCTAQYHHVGRALSLGIMSTRTFASSRLASAGIGIRYTFGNIFKLNSEWWSKGVTSLLWQIQHGETRIVVPITILGSQTTRDSIFRFCYASVASIIVDILIGELLCDEMSNLRLNFMKLVLGEESVLKAYSSLVDRDNATKANVDKAHWLRMQMISKAREVALRQCDLMKRHAKNTMRNEEQKDGLVILNAVYGVMDKDTGKWIQTSDESDSKFHIMDATTQLQFWTESSALHMSAVSKRHCLGFYDVLACVSEDDWRRPEVGCTQKSSGDVSNNSPKQWLRNFFGMRNSVDNKRDLVAALLVEYKWAGRIYNKRFADDEAIDLP
jgi:hypothetical protein